MAAFPAVFYRDPSECLDELRMMEAAAKRKDEQQRKNKSRRIKALVSDVMKRGKQRGV